MRMRFSTLQRRDEWREKGTKRKTNAARANEGARPGFRRRWVHASLNSRAWYSRTYFRAAVVDARCRVSMKEASR